jgi:hypothetical protein
MNHITSETIAEMAELLQCGLVVYLHKKTGHMLSLPENHDPVDIGEGVWEEEIALLKKHAKHYQEIEKWTSSQAFQIMADFAEQEVLDKPLQQKLIFALNNRKPFQGFKEVINNAGDYRQLWFDFQKKRQIAFVKAQLDDLFEMEG